MPVREVSVVSLHPSPLQRLRRSAERIVSARRQSRTGEASSSDPGSRVVTAGFFDQYPRFYDTSETFAYPSRLNLRHEAIFAENTDIFEGRRVLDIASHGGRWSFAALPWRGPRLVVELRRRWVNHLASANGRPSPCVTKTTPYAAIRAHGRSSYHPR